MAPSRLRTVLPRLGLLAFAGSLALVAGELAVRIVRPQVVLEVTPGMYADDPPGSYRLAPDFRGTLGNRVEFATTVETNAVGLRGEALQPRDPARTRLLAVGDSFTFGVGVEGDAAWPARLADELAQRGRATETLNAGAPGYGVPDAVTWIERHGAALDPDVVVLGIFVGNDLQDAAPGGPEFAIVGGNLVRAGQRPGLRSWLYQHSHLFVLAKNGIPRSARRALGMAEPWDDQVLRSELALFRPGAPSGIIAEGLTATATALDRCVALAQERGFTVVAVVVPTILQVDDGVWSETLAGLGTEASGVDRDRPAALFTELLAARGIAVIDPTAALRAASAAGTRVYYPIDRHLTAEGHAIVARVAADALLGVVSAGPTS